MLCRSLDSGRGRCGSEARYSNGRDACDRLLVTEERVCWLICSTNQHNGLLLYYVHDTDLGAWNPGQSWIDDEKHSLSL